MDKINEIYDIVNGIEYNRDIPEEAKQLAKDNNIVVIVGGSDDLMYCYGQDSYLTSYCEHSYGWDGDLLIDISDKQLKGEAEQLGLEIYWCGKILNRNEEVIKSKNNYDIDKQGAFSYLVNENIKSKEFTVFEDDKKEEVYCTGMIIELPENFKSFK